MKPSLTVAAVLVAASVATSALGQSDPGATMPPSAGAAAPPTSAPDGASPSLPAAAPASSKAPSEPQGHISPPPPGKSEVVFFRTGAYAGAAVWYKIREDGKELGKLTNQSYFVMVLDPGPHTFTASTENKTALKLELDENEIYYVRGTVHMGILVGEPNLSPADQALFEMHHDHMKEAKAVSDEPANVPAKPAG